MFNNYWELREIIKTLVPRRSIFEKLEKHKGLVKEKGRKSNYQEFSFEKEKFELQQRLLNKDEIGSFIEISLRAPHCPLPLNADVWDGLLCPLKCLYCFADSFRSSLYTSFFDNSKEIGLRHANSDFFRKEIGRLMENRENKKEGNSLQKAINLKITVRLGIRFEDFIPLEEKKKISFDFLNCLSEYDYPVMVNSKSFLIGQEEYVKALADNKGGSAVHITMISSNDYLNKKLEPGAPSFSKRIQAAKNLVNSGVRVVARIEPFMILINDEPEDVKKWVDEVWGAGIRHITFDTYSYSASAPGVKRQMEIAGFDFERLFLLMSDSQWLGSLILNEFMKTLYTMKPFSMSTFDFGTVPMNSDDICCEVGDLFLSKGGGFSYGNNLMAIRFVCSKSPHPVTWGEYNSFVEERGGWLSEDLMKEVKNAWNLGSNPAYQVDWAQGIEPYGRDREGNMVCRYVESSDFRLEMLENLVR
jgi:DNA repair photolyase